MSRRYTGRTHHTCGCITIYDAKKTREVFVKGCEQHEPMIGPQEWLGIKIDGPCMGQTVDQILEVDREGISWAQLKDLDRTLVARIEDLKEVADVRSSLDDFDGARTVRIRAEGMHEALLTLRRLHPDLKPRADTR